MKKNFKLYGLLIPPEWTVELLKLIDKGEISYTMAKKIHKEYLKERINQLSEIIKKILKKENLLWHC